MADFELYGGKRGYLEHLRARWLFSVGAYHRAARFDWRGVCRLVFVCKGNICRSPYASERVRGFGIPTLSYGLHASRGTPADPTAARIAKRRGVDLFAHRSREEADWAPDEGDLIVVFEPSQLTEICRRMGDRLPRVTLLGIWSKPIFPYIHDPYGLSDRYFERCFSIIDRSLHGIIRRMRGRPAIVAPRAGSSHDVPKGYP